MTDGIFKPGQTYKTRGGRRVFLFSDRDIAEGVLFGTIERLDGTYGLMGTWGPDGAYGGGKAAQHDTEWDLMPPKPEKHVRWVNIYPDGFHAGIWPSREHADNGAATTDRRIACIRIEYHEGEGL